MLCCWVAGLVVLAPCGLNALLTWQHQSLPHLALTMVVMPPYGCSTWHGGGIIGAVLPATPGCHTWLLVPHSWWRRLRRLVSGGHSPTPVPLRREVDALTGKAYFR
jgi:hypothetical protein